MPSTILLSRAQHLALLPDADRLFVLDHLSPELKRKLALTWEFVARPAQLAPLGMWRFWLIDAGRGFGKTRSGAEWIKTKERQGARHLGLIGETAADARDVMVEGPAGILACYAPTDRPKYEPSKRRITWKSGATATTFSGDEPDQLRGPAHDAVWSDEPCKWKYLEPAWANLDFGLRIGQQPQCVATTTPRPIKWLRDLLREAQSPGSEVVVTSGSTYDNTANLAPGFIASVIRRYEGTRLGRQELLAQLLEDVPGALWTQSLLDRTRVTSAEVPALVRVGVALDPAVTSHESSDEMGIVAGGRSADGHGYTLRDASFRGTPAACARVAILLYDELHADVMVGEVNNGGEWIGTVIALVAAEMQRQGLRASATVNYKMVHASRGKQTRAEPVAALFEHNRAHHVGYFPALEEQLTSWVQGMKSPDHLDAEVWLYTELILEQRGPARMMELNF